ncbi:MAG: peptidylprolyl isomerase [Flavobacterium sp.]|nr:MAG: peptidylprolyl isomerase [Flavobacterium sp.]
MAVLSKIRQRSILLILIIGFCLFAFIIGDLFNKGGFNSTPKNVGSVNGKDIAFEDFRVKVANVEKSGQQGMTPVQAANRVWDQEVSVALLTAEFEKLGIRVGNKHVMEVLKNNPQIGQNPMFQNAAGKFDEGKFNAYFKANPTQEQMLKDLVKDAELNAKYQIYNSLVRGGVFTTDLEGKLQYQKEMDKVTFDFVSVPFSSIKDSDVKVTDQELTDYMKKDKKRYKAEESRELQYVLIEDKASAEDQNEVKTTVNALLEGKIEYNQKTGKNDTLPSFRNTPNAAQFVNENSDIPYDSTYVSKKDLPAEHAEALFNLPVGGIYGPYMRGDYYCVSKMMGKKAGAQVKASHILISWEGTQVPNKKEKRTKEEAKVKAEMLLAQAKANPGNFMMLALMNSDDSSAQRGGDLGYFGPNQMVKPFNDFVFNNPVGTIGLVETEFGYHIINVTDKQDAIRLATIAHKITPSETTTDKAYTKAVKFEMDANDKDFEKSAKAEGLTVNPSVKVKAMDENLGNIQGQRQIVRWAFDKETNVGDVKRFEVANLGNVIVKLKKINEKGLLAMDEARAMLETKLKNNKKAEMIKAKMKGASLEAIAAANKVAVQTAADVSLMSPMLPNAGGEAKVVATAFATGVNKMSAPIDGNMGVYVVRTKAVTKAPALKDVTEYTNKAKAQHQGDANRVIPALKADADIEDNRAVFN